MLHEIKVISCNQTRYKPSIETRAVDKRADRSATSGILNACLCVRKIRRLRYRCFSSGFEKSWSTRAGKNLVPTIIMIANVKILFNLEIL